MKRTDLLVEIGTEELPPRALKGLAVSFAEEIDGELGKKNLDHDGCQWFATPRRIAVLVKNLPEAQADVEVEKRGPALAAAFAEDGSPTRAAEGFARSCGVGVAELGTLETDKGSWLAHRDVEPGRETRDLVSDVINAALDRLPIPKRMRWGSSNAEFVRPVHWVLVLFGEETLGVSILGIKSGNRSAGHRFHCPEAITISSTAEYPAVLEERGHVIADYGKRRERIEKDVEKLGRELGGVAVIDPALLDEVTSLVEWPVVLHGSFDEKFLELPEQVLVSSMQDHQKYFPVKNSAGALLPHFITVANIDSKSSEEIRKGNERVIFPRLSDAAFFWNRDASSPLADRQAGLKDIVYQEKLGSVFDRSVRVAGVSTWLAEQLGLDIDRAQRAAMLAKCDLSTAMVGEFPELQGTMGRYYALRDGEDAELADAIEQQYMPRFAGGNLPQSKLGQVLALADKLDTLVGIVAIGQAPSGDRDPFGLRRAAIGCLRIIIECELELDLAACLGKTAELFDASVKASDVVEPVLDFVMQRLRRYYAEQGTSADIFEAVLAVGPVRPLDFHRRILAVTAFTGLSEAQSLAAANKRIENILKQDSGLEVDSLDKNLLSEAAEILLASAMNEIATRVRPLLESNDYSPALSSLAELRDPIDNFFDEVMVMSEDEALKANRLALLRQINTLFLSIADISKLQA